MSERLTPLNGGRENIVVNSSPTFGIYLSSQYTSVSNLTPVDTVWVPDGKPIYDRLPGVSERYRIDYPYDDNVAYTYIPPGEGYTGSFSMAVQPSGDNKFLVIQAGNIVWKYGTLATNPTIIDLELVGFGSARYLLAYQLYYDDSPQEFQYQAQEFSLNGQEMKIESSVDSIVGWRYTPQFAFSGSADRTWTNYDGLFPEEVQDAFLSWETPLTTTLSQIVLRCPQNSSQSGTATIYYMSCGQVNEDGYCDNPEWNFHQTVSVQRDDNGQYFEFNFDVPINTKGWRVEWSDSKVSINNIYVSGVLNQMRKPATMITNYALVAYPVNAVPDKFTNSLGEEIPLILCKLAYVDIDSAFTVKDVQDIREVVNKNYEPVTEWLTRSWDENIINLFENLSRYKENWMDPQTSMYQEYASLEEKEIAVSYDECNS